MIIYFNRIPVNSPWGGGNQFLQSMIDFFKIKGHTVVHDLVPNIDWIFTIDPRPREQGVGINEIHNYKLKNPNVKIFYRVNECDKRKNTHGMDELIYHMISISDKVVFISDWLKKYFFRLGVNKESHIITNGCNHDHFYPKDHSGFTEKIKLVTHHWSDNWLKGFDIYQKIDEYISNNPECPFDFYYIGNHNNSYKPNSTKLISPTCGKELGDLLRQFDLYVTASRWEPGGMHHIEAASCGLPILYHKDGGGINELASLHGEEFGDFEEFLYKFNILKSNYLKYRNEINYDNLSSYTCCEKFYNLICN